MKKFAIPVLLVGFALSVLVSACGPSGSTKTVNAGETWEVPETTSLAELVIAGDATITAPEGYSVTLTVDGVETGILADTYTGDIVLTLTEEMVEEYQGRTYRYRTAIDIENGKHILEKSVEAAVSGGTVTDTSATDVQIISEGERFNGIIAAGDTEYTYTVDNPVIRLTGNGGSDFIGSGAALLAAGSATLTVNNATIINHGVVRSAAVVKENATLQVNDSTIEVANGTLPPGVDEPWNGNNPYGMIAVPWMLGLSGNCRATNAVGNGTAYYNNTHIKAQAWGALSTDACQDVKLYVTDSHIETVESGYGAYADGAYDKFSNTIFDVTDYALIMTGGTGIFTDACEVNSGRFGVMFHGSANLTIDKGTVFNTKKAAIQVKSAQPTIVVDGATFNSETGVILQAMANDDPNKMMMGGGMPEGGMGGAPGGEMPEGGMQGGAPGGNMPEGGMQGGAPGGEMPEGGMQGGMPGGDMPEGGMMGGGSTEVSATFRNTTLNGDIVSSMTDSADVVATFENTTITGTITTSTAVPVGEPSYEKFYLIGEVVDTYGPTEDEYGVKVSLDGKSTWVVDGTSYITGLTLADGAAVKAANGKVLAMTVDGAEKKIKSGTYEGKIVLSVK
jgi:hypothetical protein